MNRVGEKGEGESVWLGWFLQAALTAFTPLAKARNETGRAEAWTARADALKAAIEREAWDGEWYRRGYFDDGAPLGSATSDECRIDSIAQSWAVLSGAATPDRAARAMAELEKLLIQRENGLALLFAPPFDKTTHDPGYIKGYPPGVRENGGQYTHAATWSVMAFAALGEGDKAAELFSLLNPINHSRTPADAYRYKVEPYVVCADIYSTRPHVGRGGWTWYTGSAGWLQRAGVESLLGLRLRGGSLLIDPCIPKLWGQYEATLKYRTARYSISVENPDGVSRGVVFAEVDGARSRNGRSSLHLRMTAAGTMSTRDWVDSRRSTSKWRLDGGAIVSSFPMGRAVSRNSGGVEWRFGVKPRLEHWSGSARRTHVAGTDLARHYPPA